MMMQSMRMGEAVRASKSLGSKASVETRAAESISGRATGVLFFAGFGSLWLYNGLSSMHLLSATSVVAIGVVFAALFVPGMMLLRSASKAKQDGAAASAESREMKRGFMRVNAMQWAAIMAVAWLFGLLHMQAFLTPAITFIVGAHLVPLARLFHYSAHLVTGGLLMAWATVLAIAFPAAMMPSVGALGTGAILLVSAAWMLKSAERAARSGFASGRLQTAGV